MKREETKGGEGQKVPHKQKIYNTKLQRKYAQSLNTGETIPQFLGQIGARDHKKKERRKETYSCTIRSRSWHLEQFRVGNKPYQQYCKSAGR